MFAEIIGLVLKYCMLKGKKIMELKTQKAALQLCVEYLCSVHLRYIVFVF